MVLRADESVERARRGLVADTGCDPAEVRVVVSPYRVCPIGAHSDHQHGPVLGMAIDVGTALAYVPTREPLLELSSADFPGRVLAPLDRPAEAAARTSEGWSRYPLGVADVMRSELPERPAGLRGHLAGALPDGGLSSSASVVVAVLLALADVNRASLGATQRVRLAVRAENEFVGIASGVLDPACVVGSRRGQLLAIDTANATWEPLALPAGRDSPPVLVVFTGAPRRLVDTDFNRRVEECHAVARRLGALSGRPEAMRLGEFDDEVFAARRGALTTQERRRAEHFFSERSRVRRGRDLWLAGDLAGFGALMNASCESSIHFYETGSPELIRLQEILLATPGVLGARFSGAGFGGCSVALLEPGAEGEAPEHARRGFIESFPALAEDARAFVVRSDDGARVLSEGPFAG